MSVADVRAAPFTHAARDAVAGIDKDGSLSFQRAVIQDAFRTTLDALVAAAHPAATCPPVTTAAIGETAARSKQ
jgi:hypothetical protein